MLKDTCVITFSGSSVHREYQREFDRLYKNNFSQHIEYTADDIKKTDFYKQNMQMFQYKKYFGYFLWKPFIILETLKNCSEHNVLYCDANLRFTSFPPFQGVFESLMQEQDCFFVRHEHHINKTWTKRDCFLFSMADSERYHNAHQVWTPLMGFGKSRPTEVLLNEYMAICKIPQAITDAPSEMASEYPEFTEHRWEQSVMSILVEKFQKKSVPDTQLMNWITKHYSPELMKFKEEINSNPLATE